LKTAFVISILCAVLSGGAKAADLKTDEAAPEFSTQTHEGKEFQLSQRRGQWTVLYFYPKAGTPGCTKQACAFRDNIEKIRAEGAEVFGVSTDSVPALAKFHQKEKLNFNLLSDSKGEISKKYGTKMPLLPMSKRWTFILDPQLKVREIAKDVDPILDSERVAKKIKELKAIR